MVDSGHHTQQVYGFCKRNQPKRVYPVKGASTRCVPVSFMQFDSLISSSVRRGSDGFARTYNDPSFRNLLEITSAANLLNSSFGKPPVLPCSNSVNGLG